MRVRFTPAAQADIDHIYRHISRNNPVAAQQVEDKIREVSQALGSFPGVGSATDLEDVRRLPIVRYPYTIYYRLVPDENAVDVLRVVHASTIKDLGRVPD